MEENAGAEVRGAAELPPVPELPQTPKLPEVPVVPTLKAKLPPVPRAHAGDSPYRNAGIAYSLPATMLAPIIVLTLIGVWADDRTHRSPLFAMVGLGLGVFIGFRNMIRLARTIK